MMHLHSVLESRHWWFVARARIIRQVLLKYVSAENNSLIVDVGCGTGGMVDFLSDEFRCVGIDHSELAISHAKKLYPTRDFRCGTVPEELDDFKDDAKVFLLMDVLEHIENDHEFLKNIVEAIPPEGILLITVPARKVLWSQHDVTAHHVRRYEMDEFKALWDGMGLKSVCVSYFNSRLYPIIRFLRFLGNRLNITLGDSETDFKLPPKPLNWFLTEFFAGEAKRIMNVIDQKRSDPYRVGVSLLAVLKK